MRTMKQYRVYYVIKDLGREWFHCGMWHAYCAREACDHCKAEVYRETGRNAFRPQAVLAAGDTVPEGVRDRFPCRKPGWKSF